MMQHWPWWLGGLALASVALAHWFVLGRQMAVSGRFTAIVNRWRFGPPDADARRLHNASQAELLAAIREATLAEFGSAEAASSREPTATGATSTATADTVRSQARGPRTLGDHAVFLGSLVLGGLVSAASVGSLELTLAPTGEIFAKLFGETPGSGALVLLAGGALVGAGTRMAAGCTSGHGLCGVSRLQPGSLLATVAFFGAAVATAFALRVLL
ncbi:MAG TPA: hypothetical protein VFU02_20845 [Polyangiaceae bacterium]|nr:hypothetical protein [Polyangiaceae bacterium]